MTLARTAVFVSLIATGASAQTNLRLQAAEPNLPFVLNRVATFNLPWRLAFLPDGRMLVTEKIGPIWLVTQAGQKTPVAHDSPVLAHSRCRDGPGRRARSEHRRLAGRRMFVRS